MKNIKLIVSVFFISLTAICQNTIKVGNSRLDGYSSKGMFSKNFLSGVKCTIVEEGKLESINLIGKGTDAQVKMAIYDDKNGKPNQLIATTEVKSITNGILSFNMSSLTLKVGDYWIMAIYNQTGHHSYSNTQATANEVFYTALDFDSELPENASQFQQYQGHSFAYFLEIKEDEERVNNEIKVYPNPTADVVFISNDNAKNTKVAIYDWFGNKKKSVQSTATTIQIPVQNLPKGNYIVVVNDEVSIQIIKE
ncbi:MULTISPECIES: T9SS type A sorting domain-containing protein [Flavobacterium]|uniref:T9SS type A sorting domain-containing protein n=1 Tax=Flavobacterium jumunjinense TaxID=998845 RepID=A0ABV5GJH5_9FLAO|nr:MULTISPECIES: T9SS type A sorting domain-containing protein [Flavobacterium]